MSPSFVYTSSECIVNVGGQEFIVRNHTPQFSDNELQATKQKIESALFNIFRKYMT